jgi:hypothetical protein
LKVLGLNDREYNINLDKYAVAHNDSRPRSKFHLRARAILHRKYAGYLIYEEVKLPGSRNPALKSALFLDFFIPRLDIAVEVHGQQHYEYNTYFHKDKVGWRAHLKRDSLKEQWCELNALNLYVFKFSDTDEDWESQLD